MDSVFTFTGWARPGDWANFRDTITTLYLEQDKPLKEVKRIMEEDYYFFATEKVYKSHLGKWGVQKYLKSRQVSELLAEKLRRAALGKSTESFINERKVDEDRLNAYLRRISPARRKQIETMASSLSQQEAHGEQCLVCRTPSPRPPPIGCIPHRLEAPDNLKAVEDSFYFIRVYVAGSNDSGRWGTAAGQRMESSIIQEDWISQLNNTMRFFVGGFISHGFRLLSHWFDQYKKLLLLQHPLLIIDTCWALSRLAKTKKDLMGVFTDYADQMSQTILGSGHPISSFFSTIKKAELTETTSYLATLVQYYLEIAQLADRFDAVSVVDIYSYMCDYGFMECETALAQSHQVLQGELMAGHVYRDWKERIQVIRLTLAWMHYRNRSSSEARAIIQDVLSHGNPIARMEMECYRILQSMSTEEGDYDAAIDFCYKELQLSLGCHEVDNSFITSMFAKLQDLLRLAGREDEIRSVRADFDNKWDEVCENLGELEL